MKLSHTLLTSLLGFYALNCQAIDYQINLTISPEKSQLTAVAHISAPNLDDITLDLTDLTAVQIAGKPLLSDHIKVALPVEIHYQINNKDLINPTNVVLLDNWYPQPQGLAHYQLTANLPADFKAISEADNSTVQAQNQRKTHVFHFDHPLDHLTFIASNQYQVEQQNHNNIRLHSYFLPDNAPLAKTYLQRSIDYLRLYEQQLGAYPYQQLNLVETPLPAGSSMPTYTLLGSKVIRLPFILDNTILDTSLGHEILHQWLGNSVYIDHSQGNWAEGLTNYLAEHFFAAQRQQDAAYRQQIMADYQAYVHQPMAVKDFRQRQNKAQSAVGYGKVAMIFHQLKQRYGEKQFLQTLRQLIQKNTGKKLNWQQIQQQFEQDTGDNLSGYFQPWLNGQDIPNLQATAVKINVQRGQIHAQFELRQDNDTLYPLSVPLTIHTDGGIIQKTLQITQKKQTVDLILPARPHHMVLDENYDLMRQLSPAETPLSLNRLLGDDAVLAVVEPAQRADYQAIINALTPNATLVSPDKITFAQMQKHSLLLLGKNSLLKQLFAHENHRGLWLQVNANPYNDKKIIVLAQTDSPTQTKAAQRKLSHYGPYQTLQFNQGQLVQKQKPQPQRGLLIFEQTQNHVLQPQKTQTISQLIKQLQNQQIIYIGEQHDQMAHHLNQLAIIQGLAQTGKKIAVAMEMFQRPYQTAIDDYISGKTDEAQFLKQTQYFDRWRYDYNLYKPIIDHIKQQHIPLLALNIAGDINRKIAHQGIAALTQAEQHHLPRQLDFSNRRYQSDLFEIYQQHKSKNPFAYFLQAQTVWDEIMAQTVVDHQKQHPDTTLIVLAGNGHLQQRYGIVNRVQRQLPEVRQQTILQDEDISPNRADHVIFSQPIEFSEEIKLGVYLNEENQQLKVKQINPQSLAAKIGIQQGDILLQLNQQPLTSVADLKGALYHQPTAKPLQIMWKRKNKKMQKTVKIP